MEMIRLDQGGNNWILTTTDDLVLASTVNLTPRPPTLHDFYINSLQITKTHSSKCYDYNANAILSISSIHREIQTNLAQLCEALLPPPYRAGAKEFNIRRQTTSDRVSACCELQEPQSEMARYGWGGQVNTYWSCCYDPTTRDAL